MMTWAVIVATAPNPKCIIGSCFSNKAPQKYVFKGLPAATSACDTVSIRRGDRLIKNVAEYDTTEEQPF